jgi:hypothetical protein
MKFIIKSILNFLFKRLFLRIKLTYLEKIEKKNILQAKILINLQKKNKSNNINNFEFSVFSQWGEDGIINYLINNLKLSSKNFIEFGVENYIESNTRFLLQNYNWSGVIFDSNKDNINQIKKHYYYWRHDLNAVHAFINVKNINDLISKNIKKNNNVSVLSIDIDGNDYWVWKSLKAIDPDIVIIEYNYRFGKKDAVTVPYMSNFNRFNAHYSSLYYGASLKALCKLAEKKRMSLVCANLAGNNAFFVKNKLLNSKVKALTIDNCFREGKFRESRDQSGSLSFKSINEEKKILKKFKLIKV